MISSQQSLQKKQLKRQAGSTAADRERAIRMGAANEGAPGEGSQHER